MKTFGEPPGFGKGSMMQSSAAESRGYGAQVIPLASRAKDFLVLTTQRTGSTWLMDRLNNSPEVEGHVELFYYDVRREPPRAGCNSFPRYVEMMRDEKLGGRPFSVWRYLDRFYSRKKATGFKLMYSQLRVYPEILPWLAWHRIPIVNLVRENHFDIVISETLAASVGSSHATVDEYDENAIVRLYMDPQVTVKKVRWLERKQRIARQILRSLPNPRIEVTYEKLCADDRAFDPLFDFLNVDKALVKSKTNLVKRQQRSHDEVIENYAEVRDAMLAAGYASLLHG